MIYGRSVNNCEIFNFVRNLAPCAGEVEIDSINSVEDTKGNNGERGALSATNLRLIWVSHRRPKTNLSANFILKFYFTFFFV